MRKTNNSLLVNTPGQGNFTVPAGVYVLFITACGAGGGGARGITLGGEEYGGCGGGGSGFTTRMVPVVPGQTYRYYLAPDTVAASDSVGSGSDGRPTSFGNVVFLGGGGASGTFAVNPTASPQNRKGRGNNFGGDGGVATSAGANSQMGEGSSFGGLGGNAGATNGSRTGGSGGGAGAGGGGTGSAGVVGTSAAGGSGNLGDGGGGSGGGTTGTGNGGQGRQGFMYIRWSG